MGGKQVGSKNRAKQRRRRRLGILPLTPLRQIQSAFAEKYPSLPFLSFAFIYAWVCMTFPAGEWANWQNLDSSTIKLLPVFSNVPALIVFGAVILAAEQWNRWLDSPPFLLGSGLAGSIGCILMMTAPFSEEKDVLFLVGCMVADFGTAPLTIALARIFARRGPRTTLTFVLLFMVVGIAIWHICLSIPVDYARTIYVLLPLAASLPLLASPKNSLYSCADKTTGETPPSLGSILRFTAVFAFFTLLASFAMSLSGGGIHLRSSYEIAFFWAIVLASCLAVMSLAWFRYKTVERLYYTLALCEVAILVLTAFIGYDEITTFVFIAVLNTLFDAISWSVISAAAYSATTRQLQIVAIGRFAFPLGSVIGWVIGQYVASFQELSSNLALFCGIGALLLIIGFTFVCTNHSLSDLVSSSLASTDLDPSELNSSLAEAHLSYLSIRTMQLANQFELTQRESELLSLMIEGRTNTDIAQELFISENTVKTHIKHVYQKLGIRSREELHALANSRDALQ